MADKAIFELVVTDRGVSITEKKIDDLGSAVQRTTKHTKDASKAQGELN